MLNGIHRQFIGVVKEGRGQRLKDDKRLFSGLVWTGEESVELGLVDGLGSSSYVAREVIEAEDIVNYSPKDTFFEQFAGKLGTSFGQVLSQTVDLKQYLLK